MTKLYGYLLGLLGLLGSVIAVYAKGRQDGKAKEEVKQLNLDLTAEKVKSETLETVVEVRDDIGALPDSGVEQRLRDKYQRD